MFSVKQRGVYCVSCPVKTFPGAWVIRSDLLLITPLVPACLSLFEDEEGVVLRGLVICQISKLVNDRVII